MMNEDLKQNKIHIAKDNIKEFVNYYVNRKQLCGTNKESFIDVNYDFSFWHYHCNPYNNTQIEFYNNKKCFDHKNYNMNNKKLCKNCIDLSHKLGRESAHVIYYVKFHNSETIGIVAYATQHLPFPKLEEKTIQAVMKSKQEHFNIHNVI